MNATRYTARTLVMEIIAIILGLLFLIPFYFVLVNSVKSFADILLNAASWPKAYVWHNFSKAWNIINFPHAFLNSFLITVISNAGIVLISSMAAYRIVRHPSKANNFLFGMFVASMVIPFQSIMIPLVKVVARYLHLYNSIAGLVICYFGFWVSLSIFLYHGFIKSIPREIEESAVVDGCTPYGVFWKIVFPLMKPMTVTIIILNSLWIWNDFLLPLLIIGKAELRTIPLATAAFFAQYTKQWDLALASLIMGVTPIIIFFLSLQKYIIQGITAGSVKG